MEIRENASFVNHHFKKIPPIRGIIFSFEVDLFGLLQYLTINAAKRGGANGVIAQNVTTTNH
jgi:hypothetical protein